MTATRIRKKFLKIIGIIVGCLLVLLTAFHFWLVHHAEEVIQDFVESRTKGKLKLEVKNFKFNWFSKKMALEDAVFYTPDSMNVPTAYRLEVKKIKLTVRSIFSMIFDNRIGISKFSVEDPDITVTLVKPGTDKEKDENSSIPQEMGRFYNSIQDAISELEVKKFEISNGRFTLVNKINPSQLPVSIGKIDFHIDNFSVDNKKLTGKEKIFFSDNVVLKSRDQQILFPDGRHQLSYRKFRINLEQKIVEFDSCTVAALKTDSSATEFSIFFDELKMTNIDFDTLYRAEVIKADSVYATNPQFKLNVDLDQKKKKTQTQSLETIIRHLTGQLSLNFVVVNNASFDINTIRNNNPSSFTSAGNNFEMQGLTINDDAKRPLRVKKFSMAIRNYENFLRDSLYALQFDSVHFNDDRIYLNNFSFQQLTGNKTTNSFTIPRFLLTGLSWNDLIFEQRLTARQAILLNPTINYTEPAEKLRRNRNKSIFETLAGMNQVIRLDDLNIVDGKINIKLNGGIEMKLDNATLSVESRSLLGSDQLSGIRRSVNNLNFSKGVFHINDYAIELNGVDYSGNKSKFRAASVNVVNDSRQIAARAETVSMNEILINEKTGDVSVDGMQWEKASINVAALFTRRAVKGASFINLTDIHGKNTHVQLPVGGKQVTAFVNDLSAKAFLMKPGENPVIAELSLTGKDLSVAGKEESLSIADFSITDQQKALFRQLRYKAGSGGSSSDISIPSLSFVPYIQELISSHVKVNELVISQPEIRISNANNKTTVSKNFGLPHGTINKLVLEQPLIHFSQQYDSSRVDLIWDGHLSKTNSVVLLDVNTSDASFSAKELYTSLSNFVLNKTPGRTFDAGKGEITALLQDISFTKHPDSTTNWKATLVTLDGKNFILDSLGSHYGSLVIKTAQLKDLSLSSSAIANIRKLVNENQRFKIEKITGGYSDQNNQFRWDNVAYDRSSKVFSADSFSFKPALSKEAFAASRPFQTDYIQVETGRIEAGPFDINTYLNDTVIQAGSVRVGQLKLDDYRDNRYPFEAGVRKPLWTELVKKIPVRLSVDSILVKNSEVRYEEINPKQNESVAIPVNRMQVTASPVKNFDLKPGDSLSIHASAYILDTIGINLHIRQSYTDSLQGFTLAFNGRSADLRVLNGVLMPLAKAQLRSGLLDTLSINVKANDQLAFGDAEFFYKDIKVLLFKKPDSKGNRKPNKFLSFLANTFVIRNNNSKKEYTVFYVRNQDRSSINYLLKILLNGATNTLLSKKDKKVLRSYKKELEKRNLPVFLIEAD